MSSYCGATKCGKNTTNVDNICELNSHVNACEGNKQLFKQLKNHVNKDIQSIISQLKSPDVLRFMEICLKCGRGRLIVRTIAGNRKIKRKNKLNDMLSLFSKLVLYTNSKNKPEHLDFVMVPHKRFIRI